MSKDTRKTDSPGKQKRRGDSDEESKGQYGSLTGLGPGGGRDIKEVSETEPPPEAGTTDPARKERSRRTNK